MAISHALTRTPEAALLADRLHALIDAGREVQRTCNGRELSIFQRDFDKVARLVESLARFNYRRYASPACRGHERAAGHRVDRDPG